MNYIRFITVAILAVISGINMPATSKISTSMPQTEDCRRWVDKTYEAMTPRQRVAQLFVPRLDVFDNAAGRAALDRMVGANDIGGILLGKGTVEGYANIINYAQSVAKVPLLVTLDGEWGLSMRVTDAPRFPYNMGLGAIRDPEVLYDYGREVARECRAVGIHVNFAPVLDVNSNPANPVIGYRSFGENPERVAKLGVAYSHGLEDGGVMSVSKHFPGHGDTSTDSHKALPTVDHSKEAMHSVDLLPFKTYVDEGLSGVMVGHLRVPSLDPAGTPASLSGKIINGLLKQELGFTGLVFTDALVMKGAVSGAENNCISALRAGADVLLGSGNPVSDIDAVLAAVKSGKIKESEIESRCKKILTWKYQLGLADYSPADTEGITSKINSISAEEVNDRLAKASVTAVYNRGNLLPVNRLAERSIAVVSIGEPADNDFSDYCAKYARVERFSVGSDGLSSTEFHRIAKADVVIVGVFSDAAWAHTAFHKLSSLPGSVNVFFVNPYKMAKFGDLTGLNTLVAAYDNTPALRRAAAQALFGGIEVTGRFPVNVHNVAPEGTGVDIARSRLGYVPADPLLTAKIDSIAQAGISTRAFPGCQVFVAHKGNVIFDKSYGWQDYDKTHPIDGETIYDLASMSKASATLGGLMKAYDEGLFEIDDYVWHHIPELESTDKASLRIRDLLYHETGMPASLNMNRMMLDSLKDLRSDIVGESQSEEFDVQAADGIFVGEVTYDSIMNRIYRIKLRPSKRYLYSCLNFCLLMNIEENITGVAHDQWVDTELFSPIGAWHAGYRPMTYYSKDKIVPTEYDNTLRRQHVHGYVHDELAAFSGGVQGNAGLFSNAEDIAKYCQMLLNGGTYGGERILEEETVNLFTRTVNRKSDRGLGFDRLTRIKSMSSTGASPSTYGHTGFTGTCFWIDPENELVYVFLSNRINPSRDNKAFNELNPRGAIMTEVYKTLR